MGVLLLDLFISRVLGAVCFCRNRERFGLDEICVPLWWCVYARVLKSIKVGLSRRCHLSLFSDTTRTHTEYRTQ